MTEWRKIEGHEGYEVSNMGEVRSYWKGGRWGLRETPKILKPYLCNRGYYQVGLRIKNVDIHRLVGEAFIPNPENKPFIDHINREKLDNRFENLRWATQEENNQNFPIQKNNQLGIQYVCWDGRRFLFRIVRNGIEHRKRFKTLEEAIAYKEEYLRMV